MKKITLAVIVVTISLALVIAGSYAWYFSEDKEENEAVIGHYDVKLVEVFDGWDQKQVSVANVGEVAALVRVSVIPILIGSDGERMNTDGRVVLNFAPGYESDWYYGGDGWYYFRRALLPGEQTSNLLESVTFDDDDIDWDVFGGAKLDVDVLLGQASVTSNYQHESVWDLGANPDLIALLRGICNGYTP